MEFIVEQANSILNDLKTIEEVLIEYLKRENPEYYRQLVEEGVIS
ncbi:MAG: hypothetical protein ACP5NZ_02540 [Nanobdellota archaeon]